MEQQKNNRKEGDWWTSPAESENGRLIMVTGRRDIDKFRNNPKYSIRVEIKWRYTGMQDGMPDTETAIMMEQADEAMRETFRKDHIAVLTGIYTGDNERDWVFYTSNLNIFGKKLNQSLSMLPLLPLEISAENDPEWMEYNEMKETTEISPGE